VGVDALKKRPAVFLDRDGVLNRAIVVNRRPGAPFRLEDFEILPGSSSSLSRLKAAGYALVVVTNQPDVARGRMTRQTVEAMHARLMDALPLDEIRVCYHDKGDGCACRKPLPGMLLDPPTYAVERSIIVGDRWRDIEAGHRAGCRATVLVDYRYDEPMPVSPDVRVGSLGEAVDWILRLEDTA
jgi:D-glycero-D-manno-heptose 1,7-bisphosphate phosphatase